MRMFAAALLLFLVGCGGYENDRISTDDAKNDPLLIPPCLK